MLATQENAEEIGKAAKDVIGMEEVDIELLMGFKEEETAHGRGAGDLRSPEIDRRRGLIREIIHHHRATPSG